MNITRYILSSDNYEDSEDFGIFDSLEKAIDKFKSVADINNSPLYIEEELYNDVNDDGCVIPYQIDLLVIKLTVGEMNKVKGE